MYKFHLAAFIFLITIFATAKSDEYEIIGTFSNIYEDEDFISFDYYLIYNKTLEKYQVYSLIHYPDHIWPTEEILEYLPHMLPIDDRYFDFYKDKFKEYNEEN